MKDVTIPEPENKPAVRASTYMDWRGIFQSSMESAHIEGFALEHLIDRQHDRALGTGVDR
ncbi:hypothetical protein OO012_00365 [Rhodobacteraceae bacterium KMM 6894]|nr:hypothetical protein [Rhodobacteraceae bacterium KMM 6894]